MQFIDLKAQYAGIKNKLDANILKVLEEGPYIMGPQVMHLEERLAAYVGRKHCVSCSNGTDAITMSLMALGIGCGDAVFVPDFTFFATAEVVAYAGATPIFVDINPETYNMDYKSLEQAVKDVISEKKLIPKAIIPVDLFGQTADYKNILPIANKYSLKIIEDGAQGFGGSLANNRACSFGDISTTSFFPAKPLGCYGDGGAIFTDDDEIYRLLKSIRVHGSDIDKYNNVRIGLNARLDTIQAVVLDCKMDIFDEELEKRNKVAAIYTEMLKNYLPTPKVIDTGISSWAQYTVRITKAQKRAEIIETLKKYGIPAMIYYAKPMHLQGAFQALGKKVGDYKESEKACEQVLSLPMHPYLLQEDQEYICQRLIAALK